MKDINHDDIVINQEYVDLVNNVANEIFNSIEHEKVSTVSATNIILNVMEIVEKKKKENIDGKTKKNLVISVLNNLVSKGKTNEKIPKQLIENIEKLIENRNMIEDLINGIIDVANGKFNLQRTIKFFVKCFSKK